MNRRDFFYSSLSLALIPSVVMADGGSCETFEKDALLGCPYDPFTPYSSDIFFSQEDYITGYRLLKRLRRVQSTVGHGNFNVISFDETLKISRYYSNVGLFSQNELALFDKLFHTRAEDYGFFGSKVVTKMTTVFPKKEMIKVPRTGHFLYRGEPLQHYEEIKTRVGSSIVLTSGIRGIVKQMYLFLNKAYKLKGNLSLASHSLAPAGYSYHGIGDFDVGKVGFGYRNFTEDFETTDEFKRLMDLGFVAIRYPHDNPFGVRYEPWHIKVI